MTRLDPRAEPRSPAGAVRRRPTQAVRRRRPRRDSPQRLLELLRSALLDNCSAVFQQVGNAARTTCPVKSASPPASRTTQVSSGWTMSLCAPLGGAPSRTMSLASMFSDLPGSEPVAGRRARRPQRCRAWPDALRAVVAHPAPAEQRVVAAAESSRAANEASGYKRADGAVVAGEADGQRAVDPGQHGRPGRRCGRRRTAAAGRTRSARTRPRSSVTARTGDGPAGSPAREYDTSRAPKLWPTRCTRDAGRRRACPSSGPEPVAADRRRPGSSSASTSPGAAPPWRRASARPALSPSPPRRRRRRRASRRSSRSAFA